MAEGRIIFVSSDLGMLTPAARAIMSLIFPFQWQSVFIPVLPARLATCLEMPVPYIIGVHRVGTELPLPDDDFVLCDLDADAIFSSSTPPLLPTPVRSKLQNLLSLAAPLHSQPYDIARGTPKYVHETFPMNQHVLADSALLSPVAPRQNLFKLVAESSSAFSTFDSDMLRWLPIVNASYFGTKAKLRKLSTQHDNGSVKKGNSSNSSNSNSSNSSNSSNTSETDLSKLSQDQGSTVRRHTRKANSVFSFASTLRSRGDGPSSPTTKKRQSAPLTITPMFDGSETFIGGTERKERSSTVPSSPARSPVPSNTIFNGSVSELSPSPSLISSDSRRSSTYSLTTSEADTSAAQSPMTSRPSSPTARPEAQIVEGHILLSPSYFGLPSGEMICSICLNRERSDSCVLTCKACKLQVHSTCTKSVVTPCTPAAFHPHRVRAAFVRAMATLLFNYRKYLVPTNTIKSHSKPTNSLHPSFADTDEEQFYQFNQKEFLSRLPKDHAPYIRFLCSTQSGSEFINEIEHRCLDQQGENMFGSPAVKHDRISVFDAIIDARRKRGIKGKIRSGTAGGSESAELLGDAVLGAWRTAEVPMVGSSQGYASAVESMVKSAPNGRWPARLDADVLETCTTSVASPAMAAEIAENSMRRLSTMSSVASPERSRSDSQNLGLGIVS